MRKLLPLWVSIPLVWLVMGIVLGIHAPVMRLWISWWPHSNILRVAPALLVAIPLLFHLAISLGRPRVAHDIENWRRRRGALPRTDQ